MQRWLIDAGYEVAWAWIRTRIWKGMTPLQAWEQCPDQSINPGRGKVPKWIQNSAGRITTEDILHWSPIIIPRISGVHRVKNPPCDVGKELALEIKQRGHKTICDKGFNQQWLYIQHRSTRGKLLRLWYGRVAERVWGCPQEELLAMRKDKQCWGAYLERCANGTVEEHRVIPPHPCPWW